MRANCRRSPNAFLISSCLRMLPVAMLSNETQIFPRKRLSRNLLYSQTSMTKYRSLSIWQERCISDWNMTLITLDSDRFKSLHISDLKQISQLETSSYLLAFLPTYPILKFRKTDNYSFYRFSSLISFINTFHRRTKLSSFSSSAFYHTHSLTFISAGTESGTMKQFFPISLSTSSAGLSNSVCLETG